MEPERALPVSRQQQVSPPLELQGWLRVSQEPPAA